MIESLKKLGKDALLQYPSAKRTIWSTQWPGQIVLAISQIFWTTEVETAIKKGKLKDYLQKLKD
jgi:dynein heavy chain